MDYFDTLPDEVAHLIFSSVSDCKSLVRCMSVSKAFREKAARVTSLSIACPDKLVSYEEKLNMVHAMIRPFKKLRSLVARLGAPRRDPPTWARCMRYAEIGNSVEKFIFLAAKTGNFSDLDSSLMGLNLGSHALVNPEIEEEEATSSGESGSFGGITRSTDDDDDDFGHGNDNVSTSVHTPCVGGYRDECWSENDGAHLEGLSLRCRNTRVSEESSRMYRHVEVNGASTRRCNDDNISVDDESMGRLQNPDRSSGKSTNRDYSWASSNRVFLRKRKGLSSFHLRQVIAPSNDVLKRMLPIIHFAIVQGLNELRDAIPPFIAQFPDLTSFLLVDITESITVFLRKHHIDEIRTLYGNEFMASNDLNGHANNTKEVPSKLAICSPKDIENHAGGNFKCFGPYDNTRCSTIFDNAAILSSTNAQNEEPNVVIGSARKCKEETCEGLISSGNDGIVTCQREDEIPSFSPLSKSPFPKNTSICKGKGKVLDHHDSFVHMEGCSSRLDSIEPSNNVIINDFRRGPISNNNHRLPNKLRSTNARRTIRKTTYLESYLSRGIDMSGHVPRPMGDHLVPLVEGMNNERNHDEDKCLCVRCIGEYTSSSLDVDSMDNVVAKRSNNKNRVTSLSGMQYESRNDDSFDRAIRVGRHLHLGHKSEESQALRIESTPERSYNTRMWRRAWRERVRQLKDSLRSPPLDQEHYNECQRERARRDLLRKRQKAVEKDPDSFDYTFWRAEQISSCNYVMSDVSVCIVTNDAKPLDDTDKEDIMHDSIAGPLLTAIVSHVNKEYTLHKL